MSASSFSSFSAPWPDPNSPVISKIDFGVPLSDLLEWLLVRDTLLGGNKRKQDIAKALALARDCKHPDAVWLSCVCKDGSSIDQAREAFLSLENDPRALCFSYILAHDQDLNLSLLRRSAEMGYALASSLFGRVERETFRFAQQSAAKNERDGFYLLGHCFRVGDGCEKNLRLAKENYLIAAELGHVSAALQCGEWLENSDPVRWLWWSRAAFHRAAFRFLDSFRAACRDFLEGSGSATVVFLIGRALKGNVIADKAQIFGSNYNFHSLFTYANRAIDFYDGQIKAACRAIDAWTIIATRLNLMKDMRISIGKMIWEMRFEANYRHFF